MGDAIKMTTRKQRRSIIIEERNRVMHIVKEELKYGWIAEGEFERLQDKILAGDLE